MHTFGRRHQNLGDTRPADDRRNGAARTQSIKVTVSSQDDGVEVSTVETQMMQTTVLSTTTVAAVPDDPSPNPPPAAETTPLPPAAPSESPFTPVVSFSLVQSMFKLALRLLPFLPY